MMFWLAQTSAALCTFLSVVLERLPAAFLRTQFASTVAMLSAVLERNKDEVRHMCLRCMPACMHDRKHGI